MHKCFSIGNKSGACCCNCKHQLEVFCHPWNTVKVYKGKVSEPTGLRVCIVEHMLENNNKASAQDYTHSECELHTWRDE